VLHLCCTNVGKVSVGAILGSQIVVMT
jgi:hypothetical protein